MPTPQIGATIAGLLTPAKGILAADESLATIGKRFSALNIASTAESRRAYRAMLLTTPGLGLSISGVILFDETIGQRIGRDSVPDALARLSIIPGIKVDMGTAELPCFAGEKFTLGIDGLRERLAVYSELGARFTKWRAVIAVDELRPSPACIATNAQALSLFAALSQEAGLVPIVEPEILMDGNHTLARSEEITGAVLNSAFAALREHRVVLEHMLLKTGMVVPGRDCPSQATADEIAQATLRCLLVAVPSAVPGIVFLSGGQSGVEATERLNAICGVGGPWKLSFSFGRALQDTAMKAWNGRNSNVIAAQAALRHRAICNSLAVQGKYSASAEAGTP
jgi:fructose-bisphosphate aldolase class I